MKQDDLINQSDEYQVKVPLRRELIIAFTLVILVAVVGMSLAVYFNAKATKDQSASRSSSQSLDLMSLYLDSYFDSYEQGLHQAMMRSKIQAFDSNSPEKISTVINEFKNANANILHAYVGSDNGEMIIAPNATLPEGFNPKERSWYKAAANSGTFSWTDPYEDADAGAWVVSCSVPLVENGKTEGVFAIDIQLTDLYSSIDGITIGEKTKPFILTLDGNVVSHEDTELLAKPYPSDELLAALSSGNTKPQYIDIDGHRYLLAVKKLKKIDWQVVSLLDYDELRNENLALVTNILFIGLIVLILTFICSYIFSNRITKNILKLGNYLKHISSGDFTAELEESYTLNEIGMINHELRRTVTGIKVMLKRIKASSIDIGEASQTLAATSEETAASAAEVSYTIDEIARGASEQASEADNGVHVTKELADKFIILNEKASAMIDSAANVEKANTEGIHAVDILKTKTNASKHANKEIAEAINILDQKTQAISTILDSISSIAAQTNLLALNASIEAARAGEHGKGFAVVADEIRKLAEDSSKSADEIKEIVTDIQLDSSQTVSRVEQVTVIGDEQAEAVNSVNEQFDNISDLIHEISGDIDDISQYVTTLDNDKDNIVAAINKISDVSTLTAAASQQVTASMHDQSGAIEEVAKAAEHMSEISAVLNNEVDHFKL